MLYQENQQQIYVDDNFDGMDSSNESMDNIKYNALSDFLLQCEIYTYT